MDPVLGRNEIKAIYKTRFSDRREYRTRVWKVLVHYFNQWVPTGASVLDLGAGYCEFINQIDAAKKFAMDLNPDTATHAACGVQVLTQDCSQPWPLPDNSLDVVFTSNFLEHLPDKAAVGRTLFQAGRCLKPGGRILAMGPNIKYLLGEYWDFFDHFVELTELSLGEVLISNGFEIETQLARFLPYTMSHGFQYPLWIVRAYLALPVLWPLFGKQFLVVGRKPTA